MMSEYSKWLYHFKHDMATVLIEMLLIHLVPANIIPPDTISRLGIAAVV
jgi:hypothetical protein